MVKAKAKSSRKQSEPWAPVGRRDYEAPRIDKRGRLDDADEWIERGAWVGVKSSNVSAIRYDRINKRLFVEFLSGAVYTYEGVPSRVARDQFYTSSQGRFVWQRLRGRYPYRRLLMGRQRGRSRRKR